MCSHDDAEPSYDANTQRVEIMRALFFMALLSSQLLRLAHADDANPEHNGKTLGQWTAMARENDSPRLRRVAVVALGAIGAEALPKVRREVCVTLGKAFRSDGAAAVRAEAGKALGHRSPDLIKDTTSDTGSVVIDLAEGLRAEKDTEVKREGANALGRYGSLAKAAVSSLTTLLNDPDAQVREYAALGLGRIGAESKASADDLLKLLNAKELQVRRAAVFALGRVEADDKTKVAERLLPLLAAEKDADARYELVVAIGLLREKTPTVAKALLPMLKDTNVETRRQAAKAIAMLEEAAKAGEADLTDSFRKDTDKLVRAYALRALCAAVGDAEKLVPVLTPQLNPKTETEADVRVAVCDELGALGPEAMAAVPAVRDAQKDPVSAVRDAAAGALKKLIAKKK